MLTPCLCLLGSTDHACVALLTWPKHSTSNPIWCDVTTKVLVKWLIDQHFSYGYANCNNKLQQLYLHVSYFSTFCTNYYKALNLKQQETTKWTHIHTTHTECIHHHHQPSFPQYPYLQYITLTFVTVTNKCNFCFQLS